MFPTEMYLVWAIAAVVLHQINAYPLNCQESYQQGQTGSWVRTLQTSSGEIFEAFCLFNVDSSGYIFPGRQAVADIPQLDMSLLSNDNTHVLLLQMLTNGTVNYAKLEQLPFYSDIDLSYFHSSWDGFQAPLLLSLFGPELLYIGFLNISNYIDTIPERRGFLSNDMVVDHRDCDRNPNSHLVFYPNFGQNRRCTINSYQPLTYEFLSSFIPSYDPIHYEIAEKDDYNFTLEAVWGGCGFHYSSAGCPDIDGYAVGLPFDAVINSTSSTSTSTTWAPPTSPPITDPLCKPTPEGCNVTRSGVCVGQPDQTCGLGVMVDYLSCYDARTGRYDRRLLRRFCCIEKCQGDPCDSVQYKLRECPWFYEKARFESSTSRTTSMPDDQLIQEARCWSAGCCWDIDNPAGIKCHMKKPQPEITCDDVHPNC